MKMKTTATHANVSCKLIALLDEFKGQKSYSDLVRFVIALPSSEIEWLKQKLKAKSLEDCIVSALPDFQDRHNLTNIDIRTNTYYTDALCAAPFPKAVYAILCAAHLYVENYIETNRVSEIVDNCKDYKMDKTSVFNVLYNNYLHKDIANIKPDQIHFPIINVMGNKEKFVPTSNSMLQQLPANITQCVDVFGGSGTLTVSAMVSGKFERCIYNDDDKDKHNFIEVLCKSPIDLKAICMSVNFINAEKRSKFTSLVDAEKGYTKSELKILSAASLWLKLYKMNTSKEKQLDDLMLASAIFPKVTRMKKDALTLVKSKLCEANTFIICDPPYPDTWDYDDRNTDAVEKGFPIIKHEQLIRALLKCTGSYFIYCCRTTEPPDYSKRKEGETIGDIRYKANIEDLVYVAWKKSRVTTNLWYYDYAYNAGIIERVYSNYPFESFLPCKF